MNLPCLQQRERLLHELVLVERHLVCLKLELVLQLDQPELEIAASDHEQVFELQKLVLLQRVQLVQREQREQKLVLLQRVQLVLPLLV
jgi:hypothetical protein